MKFVWLMLFSVVAVLIKGNFCVPAIRPLSQRGIIFPVDNWDNCYLDEASSHPGLCKQPEECPDVLKKWDEENIYPKTCYFIKKQQFVCCPIPANADILTSTETPNHDASNQTIANTIVTNNIFDIFTRPSNIFLDKVENKTTKTTTEKPLGNFLDKTTTVCTKRPSNIFLDKITTTATTTVPAKDENFTKQQPSSEKPLNFDIFTNETSTKRRDSEAECDMQNSQKFATIDINGPAPEPIKFPFMAVLGWKSEADNKIWYSCGGVLISSRFVLTAAHCANIGGVKPSFVHLGNKNLTETEEGSIKIKRFIAHPSYNDTIINNDIALVELEEEEVNLPVACLWTQSALPLANFIALGYGQLSFEANNSNQLLTADLNPIDNFECQEIYRLYDKLRGIAVTDSHLCAGDGENFRHFCLGDTGGPLIVELETASYVVGITSFGLGCSDLPPSIFTRVSSFIDWIESIVWPQFDVRIEDKN